MEKKTIGKFISALRRANGMTQKELGEKLYVSDKTVSRWERDECTPELSLIPVIAEIFGITTDELLRGERNNPDKAVSDTEEFAAKQKNKSDKQFRVMLYNRLKKYKNLTLISVGISILGLIAAMIANLGFSRGLIGFCLASAFILASELCQICFAMNARLLADEDDDAYTERINEANSVITRTAVGITLFNAALWAFCLPLVLLTPDGGVYFGVMFITWTVCGLVTALIALIICYLVYILFVRGLLIARGVLTISEVKASKMAQNIKLLRKTVLIAGTIALVLGIGILIWNMIGIDAFIEERVFDDPYEFKEYVESEYDEWRAVAIDGLPEEAAEDYYPDRETGEILLENGEVIEFYYSPFLHNRLLFSGINDNEMPVTVCTADAFYDAHGFFYAIESLLYALIVVDVVVCAFVYVLKCVVIYRKQ